VRHAEDFLGGDVGHEDFTGLAAGRTAFPDMVLHQMDFQVSAGTLVIQVVEAGVVQEVLASFQGCVVFLPGAHGICQVRAGGGKDVVPQFVHALLCRELRKHRFCPGGAGYTDHTPFDLIFHGVFLQGLGGFSGGFLPGSDARRVDRFQQVRIFSQQGEAVVAVLQQVFYGFHAILREKLQGLIGSVQVAVQRHDVVGKFQADVDDTFLISFPGDQPRQRQTVLVKVDD